MKSLFLISIFLFFAITGCKKENIFPNSTIKGVVKDSVTNQALNNVDIELFKWKTHGLWNTSWEKIVLNTTNSDENGDWKLDFRQIDDNCYYLGFDNSNYYQRTYRFYETEELVTEFYLIPKAYIKIKLTNDTLNSFNKIYVELDNFYSTNNCATICSEYLPDLRLFDATGNSFNKITWTLYDVTDCWTGDEISSETFVDSIWVGHNDTVSFEIEI